MGLPNIGPIELLLVLGILLLVLGPGKLPDVGAAMGKTIREFRKASSDIQEATSLTPQSVPPVAPKAPSDVTPPRGMPADPADDAS
jgi:sec-independent protein translocase protein TatA